YVNVINEGDFHTEALTVSGNKVTDKDNKEVNPIDIYVERLAAKVSMLLPEDNKFEITMTVADDEADKDHNGDVTAKTRLFLEITGLTVANVEPQSYIAKNIEGLNNPLNGWDWNKSVDFRSHWAKSMLYGDNFDATKLVGATFADAIENGTKPVYTYETTNTLANVINGADASTEAQRVYDPNVACALITAKIVGEDNKAVELIKFQGNFYEKNTFINYILARLNAQPAGLNYYTKTEKEDGTIEYNQIDTTCINLSLAGTGIGHVNLTLKSGLDLYSKNSEGAYTATAAGTAANAINGRIADIITASNPAEAFAGGSCYYTIPIAHMVQLTDKTKKYYADKEAQFGIVRNHWYQLQITNVAKLGHGIFDPDKEEIKPEIPQDDTYGVAAQIHVLSWKIVNQQVDL
ncbi:MAG: Mfa1 fimbrilin C-terminal domain-containing protein, partial [Muribaculaceae bacterium]|nr:Mfa1 fimbrilin C-terminal domain-containing protein [Muribaculaceae bacterium]